MSSWHVGGRIYFRGFKTGKRAAVEQDANKIAMELCLYAQQKYPGWIFDCPGISIMQPLSEQVKE